jgi:ribosomal protein S6--L-glutamate ligase
MKMAILGPLERGYETIRLIKEGKKVFDSVSFFPIPYVTVEAKKGNFSVRCKNKDLTEFDCVLPRIPRSYRTFGFIVLSFLEKSVFCPIKPISLFLSHNKFLTLLVLKEKELPVPKTYLALKRNVTVDILDEVGYPIVLKLLYGSLGRGVMFVDSKESAISVMDTLERFKEPIFVEEYVPNPGEDIRVYLVGHQVIASMKRKVKKDERRANIGIGGKGIKYEIPEEYADIASKASEALGMEICGIDIIEGPKGPLIIEANVSAQFKGLESVTGYNVARAIVEYMKERVT